MWLLRRWPGNLAVTVAVIVLFVFVIRDDARTNNKSNDKSGDGKVVGIDDGYFRGIKKSEKWEWNPRRNEKVPRKR